MADPSVSPHATFVQIPVPTVIPCFSPIPVACIPVALSHSARSWLSSKKIHLNYFDVDAIACPKDEKREV